MKSTIREARERLADLAPSLNPEMYRRLSEEVEEVARHATAHAERFLSRQLAALDAERQTLLVEVCQVRDEYEALNAGGSLGRLSAEDYAERLDALNRRRAALTERRSEVERQIDRLGEVEDDPTGWADSLYRRTPSLAPNFTF